ncbi:hypothetical protein [Sorangium sp. So ce124]|uniref:hypothetical protein n=1 Tax=Sorangium sp. So ce124 TaxID=3133280 RepID=UPI003F5EF7D7
MDTSFSGPLGISGIAISDSQRSAGIGLAAATEDCAPAGSGSGMFELSLESSGKTEFHSDIDPQFDACVAARVGDYALPPDRYRGYIRWHRASDLPRMKYPLPKASSRATLRTSDAPAQSLKLASERIADRLARAGYTRTYWFGLLDGFAIITPPEKIGANNKPLYPEPERRFSTDFDTTPDAIWDIVVHRLRRTFINDSTRYRIFIFTCTSGSIKDSDRVDTLETFAAPEAGDTSPSIPLGIPDTLPSRQYAVRALAYVFERPEKGADATLVQSGVSASEHLSAAQISITP